MAHQVQMVATFVKRVRALASLDGWILASRARVGRLATCASIVWNTAVLVSYW